MAGDERVDELDKTVRFIEDAPSRRQGRLPQPATDEGVSEPEEPGADEFVELTAEFGNDIPHRDTEWLPGYGDGPTANEMFALREAARVAETRPHEWSHRGEPAALTDIPDVEDEAITDEIVQPLPREPRPEAGGIESSLPRGSAELAPQRRHSGRQPRRDTFARASHSPLRRASKGHDHQLPTKNRSSPIHAKWAAVAAVAVGVVLIAVAGLWFGLNLEATPPPSFSTSVSSAATPATPAWMTADALNWGTPLAILEGRAHSTRVRVRPKSNPAHGHPIHKSRRSIATKSAATGPATPTTPAAPTTVITHPVVSSSTAIKPSTTQPAGSSSTAIRQSTTHPAESSPTASKQIKKTVKTPTQPARSGGTSSTECGGAGVLAPTNCGRPSL
jgi:hypothetical protein